MIQNFLTNNFLRRVIETFGLEKESDEAKALLIARLCKNIAARVQSEVSAKLSPEQQKEFEVLLKGEDTRTIEQFISSHVGDFKKFVQEVAQKEVEKTKVRMQD
jgi:hypothetical protein